MRLGEGSYREGWIAAIGLSAAIGLGALPAWADPDANAGAPKGVATAGVRGEDGASSVAPAEPDMAKRSWYGWQIVVPALASDLVAVSGLILAGRASTAPLFPPFFIAGLVGHGLSGPIVHLAHGHPGKAAASFGFEAGLPGLTAALSWALIATSHANLSEGGGNMGQFSAGLIMMVLGVPTMALTGVIVDSAALAKEDVPSRSRDNLSVTGLSLAPLLTPPVQRAEARRDQRMPLGLSLIGQF